MPVYLAFVGYLFAFLGLSAVTAPLLQPWIYGPIGLTPERSLYRPAMLLALIALPLLLRRLRIASWPAAGYGLSRHDAWPALTHGLLIGLLILALLTGTQWLLGIHHPVIAVDADLLPLLIRVLLSGLLSGLAVGLIEETFFRGLMHTGMRRSLGFWPTAMLTSLLYATLHFIKPVELGDTEFTIRSALMMIGGGLARMGDIGAIADSFSTLFVAGVFLSMVRERTGHVLWAIGIHAGWVCMIKVTKKLTDPTVVDGSTSVWIGHYDDVTGWMATLWLGLIAAVYWWRSVPRAD